MLDQPPPLYKPESQLRLSPESIANLKASAPWMKFIAITSIVGCGLLIIAGLFSLVLRPLGGLIFIIYVILAVGSFIPHLNLLQCANNISDYLASNDNNDIEKAFERQKAFWTYLGVMLIVYLGILFIAFLVLIVAGAAMFSRHMSPYQY